LLLFNKLTLVCYAGPADRGLGKSPADRQ